MKNYLSKHKRQLTTVMICMCAILLVGLVVGIWCAATPKKKMVDFTFQAQKLEGLENAIDTVSVSISGICYDYKWKADKYELMIAPFDYYEDIQMEEAVYFSDNNRGCISFNAYNTKQECREILRLHFTDELDRLLIQHRGDIYYVGSTSGEYTVQECISYFQGLSGNEDYVVSTPVDITVNTVKMNADGEELGTIPLHIRGFYYESLFDEDYMFLEIDDFEQYISIKTANQAYLNTGEAPNGKNLITLSVGAGKFPGYDLAGFLFVFTEEFDRFYLLSGDNLYYIGSVSGEYAAQEIVAYFNTFTNTGITLPEA